MVNCIKITDLTAPELDVYARRSERQLLNRDDPAKGLFIAESPLVIGRALDAGYRPVSCLLEEGDAAGQAMLARCGDIPAYLAPREVLAQLTGFYLTRGMLCAMARPPLPDPAALCAGARRIAVLEEVVNPTNVGAIFRSAAALGIDAVLLSVGCSDPLYRRAIRVSMGTVFQVPWTILQGDVAWPTGGQALLRGLGFQTAAMALTDESLPVFAPQLAGLPKLAIVLGTEGDGLAARTIAGCDHTVKIPMTGGVDSLNVAAASAVAFYQLALRGVGGAGSDVPRSDQGAHRAGACSLCAADDAGEPPAADL